jgi:hypothetical protein
VRIANRIAKALARSKVSICLDFSGVSFVKSGVKCVFVVVPDKLV